MLCQFHLHGKFVLTKLLSTAKHGAYGPLYPLRCMSRLCSRLWKNVQSLRESTWPFVRRTQGRSYETVRGRAGTIPPQPQIWGCIPRRMMVHYSKHLSDIPDMDFGLDSCALNRPSPPPVYIAELAPSPARGHYGCLGSGRVRNGYILRRRVLQPWGNGSVAPPARTWRRLATASASCFAGHPRISKVPLDEGQGRRSSQRRVEATCKAPAVKATHEQNSTI
jgi:hypothetical protein